MNLAAFLLQMVQPLVARVLLALGLGILTIGGIDAGFNQIVSYMQSSVGGMSGDVAAIIKLGGFGDGIAIILGGMSFRLSLYVMTQASKLVFTK